MYFHSSRALCYCQLRPVSGKRRKRISSAFALLGHFTEVVSLYRLGAPPRQLSVTPAAHPGTMACYHATSSVASAEWVERWKQIHAQHQQLENSCSISVSVNAFKSGGYYFNNCIFYIDCAIHISWQPWERCVLTLHEGHHMFGRLWLRNSVVLQKQLCFFQNHT